jgi:hypothetical protein
MLLRSARERARRSSLVTCSESPSRTNSSARASSGREVPFPPERFSSKIFSQPTARSLSSWSSSDWPRLDTRAYPIFMSQLYTEDMRMQIETIFETGRMGARCKSQNVENMRLTVQKEKFVERGIRAIIAPITPNPPWI